MKKRILIIFLTLIFLSIIQIIFINEARAMTLSQLREKYPKGKYWNHVVGEDHYYLYGIIDEGSCNNPEGWTESPCAVHGGKVGSLGQYDCNSFDRGQQCVGFARKLFFDYYGIYATSVSVHTNLDELKPGDILRYRRVNSGGHDVWVLNVSNDSITVAECNWSGKCMIGWDRTFSKQDISVVEKIYSAPRKLSESNDTEAPTFLECYIDMSSITENSYKIVAKISDNIGVERVMFPTWTEKNGQDDLIWKEGIYNSNKNIWEFNVNKADHKNEIDMYYTHIYAYDTEENSACYQLSPIPMGTTLANLGSFEGRIILNQNKNYVVRNK